MFLLTGAPSLLFTYLNFPGSVRLSMNKCRETNYLSISPSSNTSFAFTKSIGVVIPACHVQQRFLGITRSLVI